MVNLFIYIILLHTNLLLLSSCHILKFNFTIREEQSYTPSHFKSFLESLSLPTRYKTSDRTYLDLCLGTPPQCFSVIAQTNTFYIWVHDHKTKNITPQNRFTHTKSSSCLIDLSQVGIEIYGKNILGHSGIDILNINEQNMGKIKFLIATNPDVFKTIDGMVGLGYYPSIEEEEYSFMHQLYKNKVIFHRVFTQKYYSNRTGEILIGKIPKKYVDDYYHYGRCKAMDKIVDQIAFKNKNWQCQLNSIIIGDKATDQSFALNNKKVSFLSYRKRTYIPMEIYDILEHNYFDKKISERHCIVNDTITKKRIKCKNLDGLKDLILLFGNWAIKFPMNQLFEEQEGGYEFLMVYKRNYEKFILGRPLLVNLAVVYDGHNEEIGFYDENNSNNIIMINDAIPRPPKTYEEKKEEPYIKPDRQTNKKDKDKNKKDIEEDNTLGEKNIVNKKKSEYSIASIIKVALIVFIIIIIISLVVVGIYSFKKYRKKTKFYDHNYYNKHINNLYI